MNDTLTSPLVLGPHAESMGILSGGEMGSLMEALPTALYTCDAQGYITFFNAAVEALWGRKPELGRELWCGSWRIYRPDGSSMPLDECPMAVTLREGRAVMGEEIIIERPDGVRRNVLPHPRPIVNSAGEVVGAINILVDITDRKRAEQALHANDREIRGILDSSLQFMGLLDPAGKVLEANSTFLAFIGATREEVVGQYFWETKWWSQSGELTQTAQDAVRRAAAGEIVHMETRQQALDGSWVDVEFSIKPIRDAHGEVVRLLPEGRNITDRKAVEMALKAAKESAESANRAKDRFLSVLSHELRTPLTPVLMSAAALEDDPELPSAVRSEIGMIRRNVELEAKLIDDLLDLSRIASGKLRLQVQAVELNATVRDVCQICRPQLFEKKIRLELELDGRGGGVMADRARLQQMLWNVLMNAVKFTPEGGRIFVSTGVDSKGMLKVEIRDTGIGIAAEVLPGIFDTFVQGSEKITRQFGGLGLGLAISRALVELHNGSIVGASEGLGQGTTITIRLPAVGAAGAQADLGRPAQDVKNGIRPRLLLVEDHGDTARAMCRLLRGRGYRVASATSVAEALALAAKESFDLVVSDLGLPDQTGYELMRQLRERHGLRGIAMSGYGMDDDIQRSRNAGFSEHLVKPIRLEQLEETIRRVVSEGH